jgi:hypothetical protein
VTLGFGIGGQARGTAITLDVFSQIHALAWREYPKDPDVPATNLGAPGLAHGGSMLVLGATVTVGF